MTKIKVKGYKRVQKRTAKRLYNLVPCKVAPDDGGHWIRPYGFNKKSLKQKYGEYPGMRQFYEFDSVVNSFTHYNCCNELGTYPAFYIKEDI